MVDSVHFDVEIVTRSTQPRFKFKIMPRNRLKFAAKIIKRFRSLITTLILMNLSNRCNCQGYLIEGKRNRLFELKVREISYWNTL